MGFTGVRDYVADIDSNGQFWHTSWQKTVGIAPYTAGRWYDMTMLAGSPRSNVYPGGQLEAKALTYLSAGNLWHAGAVSPATKHVKLAEARVTGATTVPSTLMLCDFLLFYALMDCDEPGLQTMDNTVTLPRYTDGKGVQAMIVSTQDLGAASASIWMDYRDSDGDDGRNIPVTVNTVASSIAGQIMHSGTSVGNYGPFLPLQAGDKGIRRINSIQLSNGCGGGWAAIVLVKPLLTIPIFNIDIPLERDYFTDLPSLPRVYDGAYLGWLMFTGSAVPAGSKYSGHVEFAWG